MAGTGQAVLQRSFKELRTVAESVRPYWTDDRAREFFEQAVDGLDAPVRATTIAMDEVDTMVSAALRECG